MTRKPEDKNIFTINIDKEGNALTLLLNKLNPWSKVLIEKLTELCLAENFYAIYGTLKFIAAFTTACPLSLPEPDQSSPCPTHLSKIPSTSRFSECSIYLTFPHQNPVYISTFLQMYHLTCHFILLDFIKRIMFGEKYRAESFVEQSYLPTYFTEQSTS